MDPESPVRLWKLAPEDIGIEDRHPEFLRASVHIKETKNGDERTLELPDIAVSALRAYLASTPKAMPSMALFVATDG